MSEILNTDSQIVYHYTTFDALISIIRKDNIQLRATSCAYLNDKNEIVEGVEALKRTKYKICITDLMFRSVYRHVYITSFSKEQDSLPMWGMYAANGGGCAIGFDLSVLRKSYQNILECEYGAEKIDEKLACRIDPEYSKILYNSGQFAKVATSEKDFHQQIVNLAFDLTCSTSKDINYSFENEYRGIMKNFDRNQEVFYKNRNGVLTPYINITLPKEALKRIVIGPTNNFHSQQSVANFLSDNAYDPNSVKIIPSSVPYRG